MWGLLLDVQALQPLGVQHRNPQGPALPGRPKCRLAADPRPLPRQSRGVLPARGRQPQSSYVCATSGPCAARTEGRWTEYLARRAGGGLEGPGLEPAPQAPPQRSGLLWAWGSSTVCREEVGRAMSSVRPPNFLWAPPDSESSWISAPASKGAGGDQGTARKAPERPVGAGGGAEAGAE